MRRPPFSIRKQADVDFDAALDHYLAEAGEAVALRFIDVVEHAQRLIADNPQIGSTRLADQIAVPGVRSLPISGFPYFVIYIELERTVEIWRLLHQRRDVANVLDSDTIR